MSGKPLGIEFGVSHGAITMRVTPIDRTVDHIWDSVREAIDAGMTPEQFKRHAAEAWVAHLADDGRDAAKELRK